MAPKSSNSLSKLPESLAAIFDQAQSTLANHRKNCVALYKLHIQAGSVTQLAKDGASVKLIGERAFGDAFVDMINRVLVVKKGPATADRIVRFVGAYVKFMNEKVTTEKDKAAHDPSTSTQVDDDTDDSLGSRFVSRLLKWLLQGFTAKNKATRYRSICFVSEMIAHLGEIERVEDTYNVLRDGLMERICDKESLIRAHAVTALSKLIGSEDPDELEPGEKTILEILLDVITYDPMPEVRRAALLQVPILPTTLDIILSRTRDTDPLTRKLVYSNVLQTRLGHPRQLTIAQREQIVKDGLGDREPSVRVAAGKLAGSWFDIVLAEDGDAEESTWEGDDGGVMKGFLRFLALFDVVGPGEGIAVDAMLSIFVTRPNITDAFSFPESYWKELTPESAVMARVFIEHCLSTKDEARLESASLPVVTAFAFHLQEIYNGLLDALQEADNVAFLNAGEDEDEDEAERREEELAKREVILGEMLRMALKLDYMDEIGRRKVFQVVKDMVAHPELPPGLINPCLDVLKEILPTERELIRVIVEIIVELREEEEQDGQDGRSILNDESHADITQTTITKDKSIQRTKQRDEMSSEERLDADIKDMRCLTLCIGMLERVDGTFEDNSTLEGILSDLIIPSVKRKELAMREKGLVSLGLCCLIAKNMALSSFQLFLGQVQSAPEELKLRVMQVIFDLLIMYDQEFFGRSEEIAQKIIDFLLQTLETEESPAVQAVLCMGLSKLLLSGKIHDLKVLTCLVLTYVSPNTVMNQELRQCLSYFFPVYCYSSPANQHRMQSIFITVFDLFKRVLENLDEDQEMISPQQFGLLIVDWTNPQKGVDISSDRNVHIELAVDILGALYDPERSVEDQKVFCQLLGHLHIMPGGLEQRSVHKLNLLLTHHEEQCPFNDDSVLKIFRTFKSRFSKIFVKDLQRIDPGKYLDDEFIELYKFIGIDPPEESSELAHSHAGMSRSQSVAQSENDGQDDPVSSVDEEESSSPTPSPRKAKISTLNSKPSRAVKQTSLPQDEDEGEEDENEDDDMAMPIPAMVKAKKRGVKRSLAPGTGAGQTSPLNRKKTRVKSPPKSRLKQTTVVDTESDNATPTKSMRRRSTRRAPLLEEDSEEDTAGQSDVHGAGDQAQDEASSDELEED